MLNMQARSKHSKQKQISICKDGAKQAQFQASTHTHTSQLYNTMTAYQLQLTTATNARI